MGRGVHLDVAPVVREVQLHLIAAVSLLDVYVDAVEEFAAGDAVVEDEAVLVEVADRDAVLHEDGPQVGGVNKFVHVSPHFRPKLLPSRRQ